MVVSFQDPCYQDLFQLASASLFEVFSESITHHTKRKNSTKTENNAISPAYAEWRSNRHLVSNCRNILQSTNVYNVRRCSVVIQKCVKPGTLTYLYLRYSPHLSQTQLSCKLQAVKKTSESNLPKQTGRGRRKTSYEPGAHLTWQQKMDG